MILISQVYFPQVSGSTFCRNYSSFVFTGKQVREISVQRELVYQCDLFKTSTCLAYFQLERSIDGSFRVTRFRLVHNHVLERPPPPSPPFPPSRAQVPLYVNRTPQRRQAQNTATISDLTRQFRAIFKSLVFPNFDDLWTKMAEFEKVGLRLVVRS